MANDDRRGVLMHMLLMSAATTMCLVGRCNAFLIKNSRGTMMSPGAAGLWRGTSSSSRWATSSLASSTTSNSASVVPLDDLYLETPLIRSNAMSSLFPTSGNVSVYLKLDCLQKSGSFKDRGMARLCHTLYYEKGCRQLVSSSGGNAGLAVATVASRWPDLAVRVIVPRTTKQIVIEKLNSLGADVTVHGDNWNQADALAREIVGESDSDSSSAAAYVSPYDDPLLWQGHSTLVPEILQQLPTSSRLGALVVSVGGGGLLCGVLRGLQDDTTTTTTPPQVVAAETEGCSAFAQAWRAGRPVALTKIDSVATSLGALEVTEEAIVRGRRHPGKIQSSVCTDEEAVRACVDFVDDHRILVEPACGAALATVYCDRLRESLWEDLVKNPGNDDNDDDVAIVIEVCGGSGVNLELMNMWKEQFQIE